MTAEILSISALEKRFDARPVLKGVSLGVGAGETVALTGESGSGKSTLLHLCAGLDQADAGRVAVMAQDILALPEAERARLRREHIGLVFQQFNLVPSLTVAQNIGLGARLAQRHDPEFDRHLGQRLGIGDLGERFPEQLSGGQQQRVAIARALAARPDLILADEPTGNLDEDTGDAVLDLLLDLVSETGCALLMSTHSLRLAGRLSRRVHLRRGQVAPSAHGA